MSKLLLIEQLSAKSIADGEKTYKKVKLFQSRQYEYTASRRAALQKEITEALIGTAKPFAFEKWHRIIDFQHSHQPLSTIGSYINDPGGRFNIGDINSTRFPRYSALYIAESQSTALKEAFGIDSASPGLTERDFGLISNPHSSIVLSGQLKQICDLRDTDALKAYVKIIKAIDLPSDLRREAQRYGTKMIATVSDLLTAVLHPHWRAVPSLFDIPSTSQCFGLQLLAAGFDGVVYPSAKTKKTCLCVWTKHFVNSESFIKLEGEHPPLAHTRIDQTNWKEFWHTGI